MTDIWPSRPIPHPEEVWRREFQNEFIDPETINYECPRCHAPGMRSEYRYPGEGRRRYRVLICRSCNKTSYPGTAKEIY